MSPEIAKELTAAILALRAAVENREIISAAAVARRDALSLAFQISHGKGTISDFLASAKTLEDYITDGKVPVRPSVVSG